MLADVTRKSKPFLMRGEPRPSRRRPIVADEADPRVPEVRLKREQLLKPEQLRALTRQGTTDPRLRPVDRCFERWAVTHGDGPALPLLAESSLGVRTTLRIPPLADRDSLVVDRAVKSAPGWAATFVRLWYRSDATVAEIAEFLHIRRRQSVYDERTLVLSYYLGRLTQMGLVLPDITA